MVNLTLKSLLVKMQYIASETARKLLKGNCGGGCHQEISKH